VVYQNKEVGVDMFAIAMIQIGISCIVGLDYEKKQLELNIKFLIDNLYKIKEKNEIH